MERRKAVSAILAFGATAFGPPLGLRAALAATKVPADPPINALVMGVSYMHAPENFRLNNTLADARSVAGFFRGQPNHMVTLIEDPTLGDLNRDIEAYIASLSSDQIALIYYAGHGVQIQGQNYIVASEADALVPLDSIVEQARVKARMVVLFLDACRNNPFGDADTRGGRAVRIVSLGAGKSRALPSIPLSAVQLGLNTGLAQFHLQGRGVKIVFSTDPGNVAMDGDTSASNSPFTAALVRALKEPKSLDEALADVTRDVAKDTGGKQTPWVQGSLEEMIYVAGRPKRFDRRDIKMPAP